MLAVTAVVGALLLGGCAPTETPRSLSSTSSATTAPAVSPAAGTATQDTAAAAPAGTTTMVTRVIDGDTFVVTGNVKIRVLGIDSCESNTPGGTRATQAAQAAILGQPVRLTAQPGVDLDRYGRELRYVSYSGGDFAEMMVRGDHTAIYTKGHDDASAAVQARLQALDANGRTCGDPVSSTTSAPRPAPAVGTPKPQPRPAAAVAPAAPASSAYYANCTAARAAGVAPLHRGEPGYSAKLDRDGDGIACE
ncbi:thermonuclease family protein [Actinomycetospora endophytica]|uniref:Thermonuclease family protein n=1 Tax=Actinomycetospora endophytica TaxID=2291215 RepID=A0ABS8P5N5_9PSEU|nr:thermonuclease family protein [Actinomycetospora endophytica]MCD2193568.1 thermonuclease family protein [Actinomycetospora endophytica]